MKVTVKFFGILKEYAETKETALEIRNGIRANELYKIIVKSFPEKKRLPKVLFAVNQKFAQPSQTLRNGDEFALIPPMSGG